MRRVRNGLHGFFQLWAFHLVEYQRQQNRERERHYKVIQAQPYRISQQPPEIIGIKETVQVLHSNDKWYGVTYKEDKATVVAAIAALKQNGIYQM